MRLGGQRLVGGGPDGKLCTAAPIVNDQQLVALAKANAREGGFAP